MTDAEQSAIRLHDFIRANAGQTSDWPLCISSTDPKILERLDTLLREFRETIASEKQETTP